MIDETKSSHRDILKSTGIFGFVHVLKILISIVGSKCIAIFIGPVGIGLVGLLNSSINIISSITSFGFSILSVRQVALVKEENNLVKQNKVLYLIKKWAIFIGIVGATVTIIFSPYLSEINFGNKSNYFWFIILSINFIFTSSTACNMAILQGFRMVKALAISNVVTSLLVTIISIPIYFFFKLNGILPVILISGLIGLLVTKYYTRKIEISNLKLSIAEIILEAKPIYKTGFLLSINLIFGYLCTFIIKLYLKSNGVSIEILGYYEVSLIILLSYVSLIFNAMGTDFYPRLASVQSDTKKVNALVNDQLEIGLLLVTPMILLFYILSPQIIEFLYSSKFDKVNLILKVGLFAVILKAIIWPLAFIILAKGENKLYFKQELLGDFLNIVSTITLYHFFGLIGIGIGIAVNYLIYGIYVFSILYTMFQFNLTKSTIKIMIISLSLGFMACISVFVLEFERARIFILVLLIGSLIFSYLAIDKRIGIINTLKKLKSKYNK